MEIKEILLSLLRSEVMGETAGEDVIASLDAERALTVLRVAKSHDLAHIIAEAFSRVDLFSRLQGGTDAPGSYIAWLCTQTSVHAMQMPGKRYDIGNLESYEKVKAEYKGITR